MPRLYFKFGAMGCSKTAQALVCKFNYEEKGMGVWMIKSSLDTRDAENGQIIIKSRIGLKSPCTVFALNDNLVEMFKTERKKRKVDAVIVDEAQLCSTDNINQLKEISKFVPVICYGLKNNFKSELFEGSKRLLELAESIQEIKSVCKCGQKATQNLRRINGVATLEGPGIFIGGNDCYEGMCYWCYRKELDEAKKIK